MSRQWISSYLFASSLCFLLWWNMAPCIILLAIGNQARTKTKRRKTLYVSFYIRSAELLEKVMGFGLGLHWWAYLHAQHFETRDNKWGFDHSIKAYLWSFVRSELQDTLRQSLYANIIVHCLPYGALKQCLGMHSCVSYYSMGHWLSSYYVFI